MLTIYWQLGCAGTPRTMWRHSNWEKTRRQIVPDDHTAHKSLLKLLFRSERGHRRTAGAHRRQGRQQGSRTRPRRAPRRSGRARRTQRGPRRELRRCRRGLRRRPRQQRSRIRGGGWRGWRLKWSDMTSGDLLISEISVSVWSAVLQAGVSQLDWDWPLCSAVFRWCRHSTNTPLTLH